MKKPLAGEDKGFSASRKSNLKPVMSIAYVINRVKEKDGKKIVAGRSSLPR